jgi:cytochrome c5
MSQDNHAHEEDHTGPIKTPKQLLVAVFWSFFAPVFIIIGLVYFVVSDKKAAPGSTDMQKSIEARLQKVGSVEIRDANRELKNGQAVYQAQCTACHTAGAAGAPKFGDAAAWAPRIKTGYEALLTSALKGKGAMAAQGGGDFEDLEIARAVVHMVNGSGGKFDEPKAPAAAGAAASAVAAAPAATATPAAAPAKGK